MSSAPATIADLLVLLPTLTRRQVSTVTIAAPPPDGTYQITLADVAAEAEASSSSAAEIRDELAAELAPTDLASVSITGTAVVLTGASWGVPLEVAVTAPTGGATTTTTTARGVPQPVIERFLAMAKRLVANREIWRDLLADAQTLRTLHMLARSGELGRYGVFDPGEAGQQVSTALGPSSASFAAPVITDASHGALAATRWGRLYWELWTAVRPSIGGMVIR